VLRASVQKNLPRYGAARCDVDVVHETLLAIHLKRHTWDRNWPIGPWIAAIVGNNLIALSGP
jgi:DNA-directed RNA polymerase specialized sigma24 family protein